MRVLITGGAGFIGYVLAQRLAQGGHELTVCDDLSRGRMDAAIKALRRLPNVRFVRCDLTKASQLRRLGDGFDHVYHLAAINGTEHFYERPHDVLRVNLLTTINLLDYLATSPPKRLMFASSSETYAGTAATFGVPYPTPEDVVLTISDPFNPRFSYAGSKIAGELLVINYARKYDFSAVVVRYHNIYGPRMGFEHVIPQFCLRLARREDPFRVFGGDNTRAFCYVDDAVEATARLMDSAEAGGRTVNVGNDREELAIVDLAKLLFEVVGVTPRLDVQPAPTGAVGRRCPDVTKLRKLTGFEPRVPLREGLKRTHAWYSAWQRRNEARGKKTQAREGAYA